MQVDFNISKTTFISNKSNDIEFYNIKSLNNKFSINKSGQLKNNKTNNIISVSIGKTGYLRAMIRLDGKQKNVDIHRLIAEVFVKNPNPNIYKEVNHINRIKTDNRIENLRWCNRSINMKNTDLRNIKVYKTDLNYNIIKIYNSINECGKIEKISIPTLYNLLNNNCRGKQVFSNNVEKSNIYNNRYMYEENYNKHKIN